MYPSRMVRLFYFKCRSVYPLLPVEIPQSLGRFDRRCYGCGGSGCAAGPDFFKCLNCGAEARKEYDEKTGVTCWNPTSIRYYSLAYILFYKLHQWLFRHRPDCRRNEWDDSSAVPVIYPDSTSEINRQDRQNDNLSRLEICTLRAGDSTSNSPTR